MGRKKQPGRMTIDKEWLDMPLLPFGGFDYLGKTVGLAPHAHNVFEITYISEGEATWVIGDGPEIKLYGGWAAITQPGVLHQGKFRMISPCRLFWAGIDPFAENACRNTIFKTAELAFIGNIMKSAGNISWKTDRETADSFEALLAVLEGRDNKSFLSLASGRITVCRLINSIVKSLSVGRQDDSKSGFIRKVEAHIQKNINMEITVSELASLAGMSTARFSERFKNETGCSPADFVRRLCCETACRMIEGKKLSMTEVAYRLKFSSSQHFAGVFKKYTGMTPSAYKKL